MEKSIQDKINQIKDLATKPKIHIDSQKQILQEDSLVKSIRNQKEASLFLNQLKFAIELSAKK